MIPFRHHVVSLVAVFLALAVGVVLGGGPLSDVEDRVAQTVSSGEEDQGSATKDPAAAFGDAFADQSASALLADRLADRQVAVVTMPGADGATVESLSETIDTAGGSVSATYGLTEAMLDPSEKSLVDTLGSQLVQQQPEDAVPADATTYPRVGGLLGLVIATDQVEGADPDSRATSAMEGLVGAELVTAPETPATRAPLVLVVLGDEPPAEGGDAILGGLLEGLASPARGVVAVGTLADGTAASGDQQGGQLTRLREQGLSDQVATVDGVDTAAGRVSAVLALARSLEQTGGAFGASGADGAAPLG